MITRRRARQSVSAFLILMTISFSLVWFSLAVLPDSEQFSVIWYASSVGAFALTCLSRGTWPFATLGLCVGVFIADYQMGLSAELSIQLALVNTLTAVVGSSLYLFMKRRYGNPLRSIWPFIRGLTPVIIISPLIGALIGASILSVNTENGYNYYIIRWFFSELIGFIALFPLLLAFQERRQAQFQETIYQPLPSPLKIVLVCIALFLLISLLLYAFPFPFLALTGLFFLAATLQSRLVGLATIALSVVSFDVLSAVGVFTFHIDIEQKASLSRLITAATAMLIGVGMTQLAYSYRRHQKHHLEQHSLLTQAMHNSLIGMAILDPRGIVQDANTSLAHFFGCDRDVLLGSHVSLFTREQDQSALKDYFNDLIMGHADNKRLEKQFLRADGEHVWGRLSVTAVRDKHAGHVTHLISQIEDINALKAAQREQKRWLERWRFALDINKLAVFELNIHTGVLLFSGWSAPLLGINPKSIQTYQAWVTRIHPDDRAGWEQAMRLLMDKHTNRMIEVFRFKNDQGRYRYLRQASARQTGEETETVLSTVIDITEQYLANTQTDTLRRRLEAATKAANIGIWEYHAKEDRLEWDPQMYTLYDIPISDGHETLATWQRRLHPDDADPINHTFNQALHHHERLDTQFRIIDSQGRVRYIRALASLQLDDNGQTVRMIGANWDNTEINELNQTLAQEREQLDVVMNSINDAVITVDEQGNLAYLNNTAQWLTANNDSLPLGQPVDSIFHLYNKQERVLLSHFSDQQTNTFFATQIQDAYQLVLASGERVYVSVAVSPLTSNKDQGSHHGYVFVLRDVSEEHALMAQLDYNANHDPLTLLPNRRAFETIMETHLSLYRNEDTPLVLAFVDLDLFKIINDSVGHHAGDDVLCQVSQALADNIRSDDTVARLGGDEFALLLTHCNMRDAKRTIADLIKRLEGLSFSYGERIFSISASVGVVNVNDNTLTLSDLMSRADVAMYEAKSAGRGQIVDYDDISGTAQGRHSDIQMVGNITRALAEDRFTLYGQQVAPAKGPTIEHWYELLVRMVETDGSIINPGQFIPAAEAFGYIRDIDAWVANYVLNTRARELADSGLRFNLNLSAHSISDPKFQVHLKQLLTTSVFPADRLCFEITESALISHLNAAVSFVDELRAYGAHVALDDFGAGLCSFHYLKLFNVDVVKVDGQFVANLTDNDNEIDRVILESIVSICDTMGYKTVAEWVSDEDKLARVQEIGINYVQGFLIDYPTPLDTLLAANTLKSSAH
ncbi:EAL domain-containing protein [Salinivibrio sp. ES.052]|uniref:EAL domain-containing protein n=1 Tax=Salinivibrio sp. ES.052 TaxID=1882823 RepID=UPI0009285259|nr:EAL domain-containing protein [Salinivibrio sp. ES.052]SIO35335.1 PAS domain S-box-containing protein/diguanylate cyclase (GGDEF) domain-containing protein [Salinivibrio sp. ES.052]